MTLLANPEALTLSTETPIPKPSKAQNPRTLKPRPRTLKTLVGHSNTDMKPNALGLNLAVWLTDTRGEKHSTTELYT